MAKYFEAGMSLPFVSIAILNWNGRHFLQQFLPSVMASSWPNREIVVIDNASTDDSVQYLRENFPAVKIVQNAANFGYTKGYNEGLKHLKA